MYQSYKGSLRLGTKSLHVLGVTKEEVIELSTYYYEIIQKLHKRVTNE